ncbi:MAG: EAL domain-containing protein [Lachnospiraceae bacterium]|nr:EAL domain-containing protein [Lachnospiraceae bacterium]
MNIKVQCCGIAILLVIFIFYSFQKKIKLNTERAFMKVFFSVLIGLVLDILSIIGLYYSGVWPEFVINLLCKAYLASLVMVAMHGLLYIYSDFAQNERNFKNHLNIYYTVVVIIIAGIFIMRIDKNTTDPDNVYTEGPSVLLTYFVCVTIMITMIILLIIKRKIMNPKRLRAVAVWIILWIIAAGVQFMFNKMLLVGFGGALAVMIIYLYLENPETNLDRQTNMFNQVAFIQYIRQILSNDDETYSLISLHLSFHLIKQDNEKDNYVVKEIVKFFDELHHCSVFTSSPQDIQIVLKQNYLSQIENVIAAKFEEPWGKAMDILVHQDMIVMPDLDMINQAEDVLSCIHYTHQNNNELIESGKVVLTQEWINKMYDERLVEKLIEDAIKNDWIHVYYQPIYSTEEKRFVSAEALTRIVDVNGKMVPPGTFIEVAEKNGMILKLGEMVFKKVCKFIAENDIEAMGLHYIEVNLSVVQCHYEFLADSFIEIMEWYHTDPSKINLEITETGDAGAKKMLLDNMLRLLDYGIRFSLDDFGTGQSNLNYIVEMPVDIVKFDRTMIISYFENKKAEYVMDAAMHMIHGMGLKIVSEGIETEDQLATMEKLGIQYIQGYFFSKPLPTNEFVQFLIEKNHLTRTDFSRYIEEDYHEDTSEKVSEKASEDSPETISAADEK